MPWKKGQSGNPNGRPKKPITDALYWALQQEPGFKGKGKTKAQKIALAAVREAEQGSIPAFTAVSDRVEGKPIQAHEITNDAETLALQAYNTEMLRQVADLIKPQLEAPIIDVTPDEG